MLIYRCFIQVKRRARLAASFTPSVNSWDNGVPEYAQEEAIHDLSITEISKKKGETRPSQYQCLPSTRTGIGSLNPLHQRY